MKRSGAFVLLGVVLALGGVLLSTSTTVLRVEQTVGLGSLFRLRGAVPPPQEVAVVGLSTLSAEAVGATADVDSWPRELHARVIDRLSAAGAAVIPIDLGFSSPRDDATDAQLAAAIARAGNVILLERVRSDTHAGAGGAVVTIERRLRPIERFDAVALGTAPFTLPKVPNLLGQYWTFGRSLGDHANLPAAALHGYALPVHDLFIQLAIESTPSIAALRDSLDRQAVDVRGLAAVMRDLRGLFTRMPELAGNLHARLANATLSADERHLLTALTALYAGPGSRFLNFYGPAGSIPTLAYDAVLDGLDDDALAAAVQGKAVFIGFSEDLQPEQQDEFLSVFTQDGQSLAGVEIGATAFANLLHRNEIRPIGRAAHWAIVALWGLAVGLLPGFVTSRGTLLVATLAAACYAGVAYAAFGLAQLWVPLVVPLAVQWPIGIVMGLAISHRHLHRQRERVQAALGYYLPPAAVARLADETSRPRHHRELVHGTCLVTDAEQYTTLSESLHPTELGELMDDYYDVLVEAVHRHGGVVSDIGGDSMVAVWPSADADPAARRNACLGALEVLRAVDGFNRERLGAALPTRLGIDCGELLLGTMGARARGEYRAVGDIVNTAARLQGLNRLLRTRVLVSAPVIEGLEGLGVRPLGEFLLVGKRTPVSVVELREAEAGRCDPQAPRFAEALAQFRCGRWRDAREGFEGVLRIAPDDGAAAFFVAQCEALAGRYPEGDWDGVVRVSVK